MRQVSRARTDGGGLPFSALMEGQTTGRDPKLTPGVIYREKSEAFLGRGPRAYVFFFSWIIYLLATCRFPGGNERIA